MMRQIAAVAAAALALAACQSTIFHKFDATKTSVSIDAKQRVILSLPHAGSPDRVIVCAEPSPDALVAISQAISAQGEVAGKGSVGFSASLNESAAAIGIRTATIQLLRDAFYRACEAYRNGAINEFGYALILNGYDDLVVRALAIEGLAKVPPAAQPIIGGGSRAETRSTASTDAAPSAAGPLDRPAPTSHAETRTEMAAGNASSGTVREASDAILLATALPQIVRPDGVGSNVVGACLMWLATGKYDLAREDHRALLRNCEKFIDLRIDLARSAARAGPTQAK
jgi:hypothetical protein